MGVISHTYQFQKRWTDADGEKVGLWMAFGIFISIIGFAILLFSFNIALGMPLKKLSTLQQKDIEAQQEISASKEEIARLEAREKKLHTNLDANDSRHLRDTATISAKDQTIVQHLRTITRLTAFETEANSLRPKIGDQQDEIRNLQKQAAELKAERDSEKQRNAQIARRLAFATEELAELQVLRPLIDEGT